MSFTGAIRILNDLKIKKVIRDYAIFDAVAATAYMEPITTEDMRIIALVDDDEEYLRVFRRVSGLAERVEGMHLVLDDVPVQIFPTSLKPIYRDALDQARKIRFGNVRVKVVSREHLILLYLEAFRAKDIIRIGNLLPGSDGEILQTLIQRFDDERNTLAKRLDQFG